MTSPEHRTLVARLARSRALRVAPAVAFVIALVVPASRPLALVVCALLAMVTLHEAAHLAAARAAGVHCPEFSVGFGPVIGSLRGRRTTYRLRGLPLGGFVKIAGMGGEGEDDAADGDSTAAVPAGRRTWNDLGWGWKVTIALAGPLANIACAAVLLVAAHSLLAVPAPSTTVDPVAGYPAAEAGIAPGDRVVAVAGDEVDEWAVAAAKVAASGGAPVTVTVERGGATRDVTVTPVEANGVWKVGLKPRMEPHRAPFSEAVSDAWGDFTGLLSGSARSVARIDKVVTSAPQQFSSDPSPATQQNRPVSPIGAANIAVESANEMGAVGPLMLAASASAFLGLFNLLPLPPLDGGHVAIATYEAVASRVRGRKVTVNRARIQPVALAVVVLISMLGLSALAADIIHPLSLR